MELDPEKSGSSCCIGDIGTHAFNMVELVTGMKVDRILADLIHFMMITQWILMPMF